MALNGTQMGNEVANAILAMSMGGALSGGEQDLVRQYWQVICTTMVNHITANGHGLPGSLLDSMGGTLSGKGDLE